MPRKLTRRDFGKTAAAAALAASVAPSSARAADDQETARLIAQSALRVLDPLWTTAYITRNHGYCVFDTLFAIDAEFAPHPQMVGDFSISPDKLTYQFKLRDGLGFHDGSPVRGADCIASINRWMARDGLGQSLKPVVDEMKPDGDKGFTIKLKEPFPLLLDGLAKASSLALFVMPERLANTDAFQQVTEMVGSGPFKFVKEEFEPGHRVVYVKNKDYVPRKEPPSWASGGKVVKVDRVEWLYIPDAMTKVAALNNGEADWWENPPADVWPVLAANPDVQLAQAGYKGEKVVVMDAVDQPVAHTQALVITEVLKKLGMNVDLQAMDWGTLVTRRASKEPIDKGGYNIFATGWVGADLLDPVLNLPLKTNGDKAWFGWPKDDKLEELRTQWLKATTMEERKKLAAAIQERAFEVVPYLPTGQWLPKTSYRKNVKGLLQCPAYLMWNVEKT